MVHPYLDHDGPIPFAHRGGTCAAPENTLAAFQHAVDLGYRYLETDVHTTRDGVLVAFHDADLRRTCDVEGTIAELTADELAEVRVGGEHPVPLMVELFEAFPDARFNIDAKSDEAVDPLLDLVERVGAIDRVCLASFHLSRLRRMRRRLGTGLITNMSSTEVGFLKLFGRLPGPHRRIAQVPPSAGRITVVDERFVRRNRRRGIPTHVWTVNDRAEMERLLDLGVDGLMTDETELLKQVLVERGEWSA